MSETIVLRKAEAMQEPPNFNEIAKRVFKKSIRSAVCIDDRLVEPYMSTDEISKIQNECGEELDHKLAKGLYKSFRTEGECDLDVYCFKSMDESWHPEYMLNNKDLVVLDWELDGKDHFESALLILKEIIQVGKIPFVIIYTYKPPEEFLEIAKELVSNFNKYGVEESTTLKSKFLTSFKNHLSKVVEGKDIDANQIEIFWESDPIDSILDEILLNPTQFVETQKKLLTEIKAAFTVKEFESVEKKFATVLNEVFDGDFTSLVFLLKGSKSPDNYFLDRIEIADIGFKINDTIVTIFSKPGQAGTGVTPENVFNKFSGLISNSPYNFITLLSLEMRDRFREDLSRIGNEISRIDERAFFHHFNSYQNRIPNYKNEFFDFLLKSWVSELTEYNLNQSPFVFEAIETYKEQKGYGEIKGASIIEPLADLGIMLSTVNIKDRLNKDKRIRFGDLFQVYCIEDNMEVPQQEYMLSITPHCVCVDECKIDNNFYFIKSESVTTNFTSALKEVETAYYTFCKNEGVNQAVRWGECKPFTLYIQTNDLNNLNSNYTNKAITLKYITTLKENFAQRMSNKAFNYGTSIGIDLPHLERK